MPASHRHASASSAESLASLPLADASTATESEKHARRLQRQLQLRQRELRLLRATAKQLQNCRDLDATLHTVAEQACALIQAETLLIPLYSLDDQRPRYAGGSGRDAEQMLGAETPLALGDQGWTRRNQRRDWQGLMDDLPLAGNWEHAAHSLILAPLYDGQAKIGALAGFNKTRERAFGQRDLELLTLLAEQVSGHIAKARAYSQLSAAHHQAEQFRYELATQNEQLSVSNRELERMAMYDHLTGLPNRALFQDRLAQALANARRDQQPAAVLMLDLDHFKEVNDTLGHDAGDELLQQVAARLRKELRESDTIARLGGDEFAVVLRESDAEHAAVVARNLLRCMEPPFHIKQNQLPMAPSIGIACTPEHGTDKSTILRHADVAMYHAKRGREGYALYDPASDEHNPGRLALLTELGGALERRCFVLHYQARVNLSDRRISGMEALVRWPHPTRGLLAPHDFLPLLEQAGLMRRFTYWVLEAAIAQCARWRDLGFPRQVSVNVPLHALNDRCFVERVTRLLRKRRLHGNRLILEVNEHAIMSDPDRVGATLRKLSALGIGFSIDDFGTGFSSLRMLRKMSVDELKIDRSFVSTMDHDEDSRAIVCSIIELAHNLDMRVVAEGVETDTSRKRLAELGCDIAQGMLLGAPGEAHRPTRRWSGAVNDAQS